MKALLLRWTLSPPMACLIAALCLVGASSLQAQLPPARAPRSPPQPATKGSVDPCAGRPYPAVWPAVKIRAESGTHAEQSEARTPRQRGADATPTPQRHDHTEWLAFRDCPWR